MGETTQEKPASKLKQGITGPMLYLFILGDVLGAGIYALVGDVSVQVGGAIWVPLVVALVLAMLTAASYAELVTKYPKAGGAAVFAQRAFKVPAISFLVGFAMLAAGVTSAAGLSQAFAGDYLKSFLDVPTVPAAIVFLLLVALLNARGISESVRSNVVMTVIEVSGLVLVIVLVSLMVGKGEGHPEQITQFPADTNPALAVLAGSILAYYSFVGFEVSANIAEEVRDVRRVYPRAIFGAMLTAGLIYVLIGIAASIALPTKDLSGSTGPLLDVVSATGFGIPDWIFSAIALVAVANGALLTMIMSSRLVYGMSEQSLLPEVFSKVLPNRKTPWVAIVATTAVAMLLTLTGGVAALAETVVLLLLFVFISTNVAVIVLRKDKVEEKHFRTPIVLPYLAIASCVLLLTQQSGDTWLRAAALMAVGLVLYFARRFSKGKNLSTRNHGGAKDTGH
ncbi:APC family permease [Arthrobacter sp. zg-Y20]|uniref:APC family permease n=1 Tax=unclassified Arthrobacter TaxID=235627 RepID=UPI001D134215|nr:MULTISPECIES: APC family permease [unclassified Arthrobacter]MCC3275194.1 APC family permease [Arthrobacter sp. zg-Y20]MDK1315351.1 APC family permease [Arthrobacter sp. zg.Y20]WIB05769.1 APC family permease [Arthrobacter sp. zg-Y20]